MSESRLSRRSLALPVEEVKVGGDGGVKPKPEPKPPVPQKRQLSGFWVNTPSDAVEQMLAEEFPGEGITFEYEGDQTFTFTVPDGAAANGLARKARDVLPAGFRARVRNGR